MSERIILKKGCRILTPSLGKKLIEELDPGYQIICNALWNTGLRMVEFWALCDNPHWYHPSSRLIDLPEEGSAKKVKAKVKERTIKLTEAGCKSLDVLFAVKPHFKERDTMRGALKRAAIRAGIGDKGIMPKMFRKWLASYLVECRKDLGIDTLEICANMGHDEKTLKENYYGIFTPADHPEILEFIKGWNG